MSIGYFVILGIFSIIGMLVSNQLKARFNKYSKIRLSNNLSGAEISKAMLSHYGIHDVNIVMGQGFLTDHYNPMTKTVSLSPEVFQGRSIAAAAVAAHECGHAVQHATAYNMLTLRSQLVPVVQFSSKIQQFLFMAVIFGMGAGMGGNTLLLILVATFGITALFSLVTLPVEFDASRRALAWLDNSGMTSGKEYDGAKDALWWAAMTYVSQALASLVVFLYFLLKFMGSRQ
ncbi:MAG TPA: zinc metallopeptidase [Saprospiraceae bacterium]|nr:zinc metallopeptidase [Saprospiraceae bacterium]